jgi:hypothetical protein
MNNGIGLQGAFDFISPQYNEFMHSPRQGVFIHHKDKKDKNVEAVLHLQ